MEEEKVVVSEERDYEFFKSHSLVMKNVKRPFFVHNETGDERFWDDLTQAEKNTVHDAGFYIEHWDDNENLIRKLNQKEKEIYYHAVNKAVIMASSMRDSIAIMRPVRDRTSGTAYTSADCRMGIGDLFFYSWNSDQRATAILHEAMHVLYRHHRRIKDVSEKPDSNTNIAADFEINCALDKLSGSDISTGVLPDDVHDLNKNHPQYDELNGNRVWPDECERFMTFEQHYSFLKKEEQESCPVHGQGGSNKSENDDNSSSGDQSNDDGSSDVGSEGEGTGNPDVDGTGCSCKGWSCGQATDERQEAMDDAGIPGADSVEIDSSIRNTVERMVEEKKKTMAAGNGSGSDFLSLVLDNIKPSKVSWKVFLRNIMAKTMNSVIAGKTHSSHRKANRRLAHHSDPRTGRKFIFPGRVAYAIEAMFAIDTSGSMAGEDFLPLMAEAEEVIKSVGRGSQKLSVFSVDTEIKGLQKVNSIHDIKLQGMGGTRMSTAFKHVNELPKKDKPDLFILATDGGLFDGDWEEIYELLQEPVATYKTIILVTQHRAFDYVPAELKSFVDVIDISD